MGLLIFNHYGRNIILSQIALVNCDPEFPEVMFDADITSLCKKKK